MTIQQKAADQNNRIPRAARAPFTAIGKRQVAISLIARDVRKAIANQDQQRLLDARKARLAATKAL